MINYFKYQFPLAYWKFLNLWLFSWRVDKEGDIAFVVCNRLAFIKYKQSTIIRWAKNLEFARKYVEATE